jgi:hypothetical protein
MEVYLVPPQVHQFGRAEAMAIGQQDHGRVAVAVPIALGRFSQPRDFGIGQILPGPAIRHWACGAAWQLFDFQWLATPVSHATWP